MSPEHLFNCCTGCAAPDWSQFDALEIGGCITEGGPAIDWKADGTPIAATEQSWVTGGVADDAAAFFTVYGHLKTGGAEAITDCQTLADAEAVCAELARLSGLSLTF